MRLLSAFLFFLMTQNVWAGETVFSDQGIAVNGHDVVAYHVSEAAIKGDARFSYTWHEVSWHFSNKENLNAFKNSPMRYAPQYGGFCAFAMSKGSLAPTDPNAWTIYQNKLYLNYSKAVRATWKKDIDGHIKRADKNWSRLKEQS